MSINRKAAVALEKKKAAKTNSKKANRQAAHYIRKQQLENIKGSKNSSLKCSREEREKLSPTGNSARKHAAAAVSGWYQVEQIAIKARRVLPPLPPKTKTKQTSS